MKIAAEQSTVEHLLIQQLPCDYLSHFLRSSSRDLNE